MHAFSEDSFQERTKLGQSFGALYVHALYLKRTNLLMKATIWQTLKAHKNSFGCNRSQPSILSLWSNQNILNISSCLDCLHNKLNAIVSSYLHLELKHWKRKFKVTALRETNRIAYINLFVPGNPPKKLYVIIIAIILKKTSKRISKIRNFRRRMVKNISPSNKLLSF